MVKALSLSEDNSSDGLSSGSPSAKLAPSPKRSKGRSRCRAIQWDVHRYKSAASTEALMSFSARSIQTMFPKNFRPGTQLHPNKPQHQIYSSQEQFTTLICHGRRFWIWNGERNAAALEMEMPFLPSTSLHFAPLKVSHPPFVSVLFPKMSSKSRCQRVQLQPILAIESESETSQNKIPQSTLLCRWGTK